jgi:phage repressor protein C with HTH and peptisase S24 domain
VNTEDNARLTFEQKLGEMFERILEKNIALYNRLTKDPEVGAQLRDGLFRSYVDRRRELLELIDGGEGKRVEFKESLRGGPDAVAEVRKGLQHASLKTIAAFLNTDGGDLLLGVRDDGEVGGIEVDGFESPDKFQLHLMNLVGEALGAPAGTLVDPEPRRLADKTVCRVNCGASPWPVRLKWKGTESSAEGDLFVRTGPQTTRLEGDEVADYIRARWPDLGLETTRADTADAAPPWRPELVVPYTEERFTICVPLIALEAVAGSWSDTQTLDNAVLEQAEDWVRLPEGTRAGPGCFVAQVRGRSMEPKIRDGAWCLFEAPVRGGTRKGRILLVQMRDATDPETGARCTVKVFERKGSPPVVTLSPINREFEPIVATKDAAEAVRPVAEWRAVLDG